jgi:hypothetical protein
MRLLRKRGSEDESIMRLLRKRGSEEESIMRLLRKRGSEEESIMRLLRERGSEEVSRRRARTASGSGGLLPGMLRSDSTGVRIPSVMETPDDDESYPAESEIDMIMADDAAWAKAEMLALVVASSLATVSVCLFRWTKIKLFQAFEKWHEVCFLDDDDLLVGHGRRARVLSMLERTKMGPGSAGQGGSSLEDMDDGRVSGDRETVSGGPGAVARKGVVVIKCFECQQRTSQAWCDNCFQVSTCFQ